MDRVDLAILIIDIILVYISIRLTILKCRLHEVMAAIEIYVAHKNYTDFEDFDKEVKELLDGIYDHPTLKAVFCFWNKGYEYMMTKEAYEKIEEYL